MSPFDLPGSLFLVFYFFCGAVALIGVAMLHNLAEPRDTTKVNLSDPYLIAYLREGRNEALRVATVSLIDRGLLKASGTTISTILNAANRVRAPLEEQLLQLCRTAREAASVYYDSCFDGAMRGYEEELVQSGLLPTGLAKTGRAQRLVLVLAVLWGIAFIKISLALERGHKNIDFLVALAIVFGLGAYKITHPRQTGRGKALLADLESLFRSLKNRSASFHAGSNPNELALLAAVFGVRALPKDIFPHAQTLYPQSSSSSGGSCGSSCGGGGCGGGCGGCGS